MTTRLDPFAAAPEALRAMAGFSMKANDCGLEKSLLELVKIRASQINGCANCLDMHVTDAIKNGERIARIALLPAWRETKAFTPRERAALAWTEALTLVAETHAPDEDYEELRFEFKEDEIVKLSIVIGVINAWNRLAIGVRLTPDVVPLANAA